MTIRTRAQLWCDVGLKCAKPVVKTLEGADAEERLKAWAILNKWGHWGDRDACPECWKELHKPGADDVVRARTSWFAWSRSRRVQAEIDEEELQRAIALRRRVQE